MEFGFLSLTFEQFNTALYITETIFQTFLITVTPKYGRHSSLNYGKGQQSLSFAHINNNFNWQLYSEEGQDVDNEAPEDQGVAARRGNVEHQRLNMLFGRFFLTSAKELTQSGIDHLRRDVNNLCRLAQLCCGYTEQEFCQQIFRQWNTACGPGPKPSKPERISSDVSVVCGHLLADSYTQTERKLTKQAGKTPEAMNFKPRHKDLRQGAPVHIKIRPGRAAPHMSFVDRTQKFVQDDLVVINGPLTYKEYTREALINYDAKDMNACRLTNMETIV